MNALDLKQKYPDSTIYVLGSGKSMDFVRPSFFDDKLCIGLNMVGNTFPCDYTIFKDNGVYNKLNLIKGKKICLKHDKGNITLQENKFDDCYIFDHNQNDDWKVDILLLDSDKLVNSHSIMTSGIHLAYFMGAKNIVICGHDCGSINGEYNFKNYYTKPMQFKYGVWARLQEYGTIQLKSELHKRGINVVSLNPFINFGLEGYMYARWEINNRKPV